MLLAISILLSPIVFVVILLLKVYYCRLPADFQQVDILRPFLFRVQLAKLWSDVGEKIGIGHRVHLFRKLLTMLFGTGGPQPDDPHVKVTWTKFDGVDVKLYEPTVLSSDDKKRSGVVYIHGGGWIFGGADDIDVITRTLAIKGKMIVASVEYRMAPEHLYPIPLDDCVTAAKYFLNHASEYGVDSSRVAIAGSSAGGNLAAAVCLKLRDEQFKPAAKLQVLLYPALQAADFRLPSMTYNARDPFIDRRFMASCWLWYAFGHTKYLDQFETSNHISKNAVRRCSSLVDWNKIQFKKCGFEGKIIMSQPPKSVPDEELWSIVKRYVTDPYFAPLMAESLEDLPRTYLVTCEQDVLRDEGVIYVNRLREAANPVTHAHYNTVHAPLKTLDLDIAAKVLDDMGEYFLHNL